VSHRVQLEDLIPRPGIKNGRVGIASLAAQIKITRTILGRPRKDRPYTSGAPATQVSRSRFANGLGQAFVVTATHSTSICIVPRSFTPTVARAG
jgi:hypothetical protein